MPLPQPSPALAPTDEGRGWRRLRKAKAAGAVALALLATTVPTAIPAQATTVTATATATAASSAAGTTVKTAAAQRTSAVSLTQHPTIAQGVLSIINRERWANRLPALSMDTKLISSAYSHNVAMARQNTMSHQCSGEASLGDRIDAAHYNWSTAGENLGWNSDMSTAGAYALQVMMYNEKAPNDGHRLITLSRAYRNVGISVVTDTTHHKLWLTADFGHLM